MYSPSFLLIIFPIAYVFLPDISPVHGTHAGFDITPPLSFKIISRRIIVHFSIPMLHIVFEVTLKDTAAFEDNLSLSLFFPIDPVPFISGLVYSILSKSMPESIFNFSFIAATVWPFVATLSCDAIIFELPTISNTVGPSKGALTA